LAYKNIKFRLENSCNHSFEDKPASIRGMLEISVKRIRSDVGYRVLSSDIFPWQTHLYCPLSVTVRLWNAFNRIYLESPKFPENLIRTWALCPPGQRESSSLSLSFTVSSTFLSFYPSFRTLIASVQLCRTRTIVSPHVLSSPVTCVAFQWLLTSSTDKFSSFRLSIVRFRCLVRKNYQLTIRTRSVFLYFSCFLLGVREKRLQRRVYIIDGILRYGNIKAAFSINPENFLFHFL